MAREQKQTGIPVIILHGWGKQLSGKTFLPLRKTLEKRGFVVYTPDLPGFGSLSAVSKPYSLNDYVEYVNAYAKRENISRPCIVGHSFGGRVGIKYSVLYPENVRTLILTGTPGLRSGSSLKYFTSLFLAKTGRIVVQILPFGSLYNYLRDLYYRTINVRDYMRSDPIMKETFRAVVADKLEPYMKKLIIPVLLLWGEHDTLVPVSVAKRMERMIPHAKLIIIQNGTHAVAYEQPREFADAVKTFLHTT